jgi:hypothetical protein
MSAERVTFVVLAKTLYVPWSDELHEVGTPSVDDHRIAGSLIYRHAWYMIARLYRRDCREINAQRTVTTLHTVNRDAIETAAGTQITFFIGLRQSRIEPHFLKQQETIYL